MSVTFTEALMQVGDLSLTIDHTPGIYAEVWDPVNKRPRKVHVLIYDHDDILIYAGVILSVTGGDRITIGGSGLLWHLGQGEVGPLVVDREYVSGQNKLSNPDFAFGDLYWRLPAENSNWLIGVGSATNAGGHLDDDTLEVDEKFPTRPGYSYRTSLSGSTGTGRMRVRTVFDGKYNPPNLWTNGDLSGGATGWGSGLYSGVVLDPGNAYGGSGYVIRALPIPKATWTEDFESGAGWTDITDPAPMSDDIDIVFDSAMAHTGQAVLKVGPVTQHQVFTAADFGQGLDYWFPSSTDAEPHAVWEVDETEGVNGTRCLRTTGYATAGRPGPETIKYLRADSVNGGGVDTYAVIGGEVYRAEAYFKFAPGSEGTAFVSIQFPSPEGPPHDIWIASDKLDGVENSDLRWNIVSIESLYIPADQTEVNALVEVHNHGLGYVYVDHFTLTRTQGNRAKIVSDTLIPVDTETDYEVSCLMRNGEDMQVGNVRVGVELTGAGMEVQTEGEDKSSTDFKWDRAARTVRPPEGYTHANFFVAAQDVIGSMWVDNFVLTQLNNNRDSMPGPTVDVTPMRTYRAKAYIRSGLALQGGDVRMQFRLIRTGYADVLMESSPIGATENEWVESTYDITPPSGYDQVELKLIFTDIEGDIFYAGGFSLTDTDTNTVVYDALADNPSGGTHYVDATAPDGTEFVRAALVAENASHTWRLGTLSLARTGVTPATGNAIAADMLLDPDTDLPLSLNAGTITAPAVIPYDWVVQNMTNRDVLEKLCNVVADPPLEFKVNHDRTLDVGEADDVFEDHDADSLTPIVLLPADMDVADMSSSTSNVEERATVIRVIGAERETVSGKRFIVQAEAVVPAPAEVDWNGRTIRRVKQIHDGTVDHQGYAQALADDEALKEAMPALSMTATLSGVNTRPEFDVGDWIYAYKPEAGLADEDNPMPIEGETVFPRRVRVLARTRELGPTHRIEIRRENGSIFNLPMLRTDWAKADSTSLTLGDRVVDWIADPQGGQAARRYLADRASRPR